jgi:ribosomal protein S27AE
MQTTKPICPQCGQLDQAQKLNAIYAAGSRYRLGYDDDLISRTGLATRYAPPARPLSRTGRSLRFWLVAGPISLVAAVAFVTPGWRFSTIVFGAALVALAVCVALDELARRRRCQQQLHGWEVDMLIWQQTFYCGRCDVTFVPTPTVGALPTAGPATGKTIRLSS